MYTGGLSFSQEQRVRDALRYGDGELLADVVRNGHFMDYEELKRFIEEQPGGYRHVSWRGIQLGDVTVVDRYGRPKVEGWYGRTTL
jgi:hypothetical protein